MRKIVIAAFITLALGCQTTGDNSNSGHSTKPGTTLAGLKTFGSCSELSGFLIGRAGKASASSPAPASPESATGDAAGDSPTPAAGPQFATVEEADIVKQDGGRLYVANSYSGLLIYDLTTPSHPERVGRLPLTGLTPIEIQVSGNTVLVVSNNYGSVSGSSGGTAPGAEMPVYYEPRAKVTIVDVTNPASLTILKELEFPGSYQESRKVGAAVYLVFQNWLGGDTTTIQAQLKSKTPCDHVYAPENLNGGDYFYFDSWDIVGIDLNNLSASPNKVSVVGSFASTLYATPNHLYVTDHVFEDNSTGIYLLDLDSATAGIEPAANASVPGSVVNQFSMDETDGVFRIASTTQPALPMAVGAMPALAPAPAPVVPPTPPAIQNYMTTFRVGSGQLTPLGQIDSITPGEVITAARFLGNHAFVTTAAGYVDPLVSVDLSNPSAPVVTASVELPGRPGYLHAWNNLLITVGQGDGWAAGVTLNLFNISDRDHPALIEQTTIPNAYYSEAQWDHRAFAFFEDRAVLAIPVWTETDSEIVLYNVDVANGLTSLGSVNHNSLLAGTTTVGYSPTMRRALEAGDVLITISEAGIKATGFDDLAHDLFGELFPDFVPPTYGCGCTGDVCMGCPQPL